MYRSDFRNMRDEGYVWSNFVRSGTFWEYLTLHEKASMAEKDFRSGKASLDFGKSCKYLGDFSGTFVGKSIVIVHIVEKLQSPPAS